MMRRIAQAIDPRDAGAVRRRSILEIAARDFLSQLPSKKGSKGGSGYNGWELSNMCQAMFWGMLLISQRRERYAMRLIGQVQRDLHAVSPYLAEKKSAQEILDAVPGVDADSLVGFADVVITQFRPPKSTGAPLVPRPEAIELLKAAGLRGAMVGELRPEAVRASWLEAHPSGEKDEESQWKVAQGRAEMLLRRWQAKRKSKGRRLL
ncbi:MAG: hypothetical protein DK306_000293 [Chloroflexi bacterium]|nr:MAG: hypothetical protein DK306_000293 [Chloroflexota bacterium]